MSNSLRNKKKTWEYHDPPEHWFPVQFCLDTSLHGLQYLGQQKRHLFERVFWTIAFICEVVAAGLLIYGMWFNYSRMPIVTVFNPSETPLKEIPFPAVTICKNLGSFSFPSKINIIHNVLSTSNVNTIKVSKLGEYAKKLTAIEIIRNQTTLKHAWAAILDGHNICETDTFSKRITRAQNQYSTWYDNVSPDLPFKKEELEEFMNPTKILIDGSQKCNEMILWCIWLDEVRNCSELFKEVVTDYGYCCTFNTIPLTLLMNFANDIKEDPKRIQEWEDENITYDNIMFTEETKNRKHPYRQLYPGRTAGLSFLLEPNLGEYQCTNSDSEGFVIGTNVPLDFPRMKDNGVLVQTRSEVFINLRPQITMSEESIRKFKLEKRNCYFDGEQELQHYSKYTASNCMDECIAYQTKISCGCVKHYMPKSEQDPLCKPDQYVCADQVRKNLTQSGVEKGCSSCLPTCTEIEYLAEVTSLKSRELYVEYLFSLFPEYNFTGDTTIVHIYFSQDSVNPRLRKELYTVIDLISNTGGLLGLCMGFSMLSLLEILYYFSIRLCFSYRRSKLEMKDEDTASAHLPSYHTSQPMKHGWGSTLALSRSSGKNEKHTERFEDNIFKVRNRN